MISKLDPTNLGLPERKWSCVWRPDVGSRLYARGSWQAAGGVGGLAWMQTGIAQTVAMYTYQSVTGNAEVHIPMMDHMGNVRHYYQIKSTGPGAAAATVTGQVTANLDYDAFGREVRATGPKTPASGQPPGLAANDPWVDNLPFHFSTKFTDRESGLNYYGYRFHDSVDGRWLSRDPIGEIGGPNSYIFLENDGLQNVDVLGAVALSIPGQPVQTNTTAQNLDIQKAPMPPPPDIPSEPLIREQDWPFNIGRWNWKLEIGWQCICKLDESKICFPVRFLTAKNLHNPGDGYLYEIDYKVEFDKAVVTPKAPECKGCHTRLWVDNIPLPAWFMGDTYTWASDIGPDLRGIDPDPE